jgi:hypothetical protein
MRDCVCVGTRAGRARSLSVAVASGSGSTLPLDKGAGVPFLCLLSGEGRRVLGNRVPISVGDTDDMPTGQDISFVTRRRDKNAKKIDLIAFEDVGQICVRVRCGSRCSCGDVGRNLWHVWKWVEGGDGIKVVVQRMCLCIKVRIAQVTF